MIVTSSEVPKAAPAPVAAKLMVPPLVRPPREAKTTEVFWAAPRFRVTDASPAETARAPRFRTLAPAAPVLSVVKPAVPPKVRACEATVPVPPRLSWTRPALTLRPPLKVLTPERARVPAPVLVRAEAPETTPASVRVLASTWTVRAPGKATAPETVRALVPRKRRFWVSVSSLATVRPATAASSEPPLRTIAPVPAPVLAPRDSVPAATVTPPVKVLTGATE